MSLMGDIVGRIFSPGQTMAAGAGVLAPQENINNQTSQPQEAARTSNVDVNAVLTQMATKHKEPLNWQSSIVDLLKVLNLDSGLSARQGLARELHYTGDTKDSATMNQWLHKQVMQKLAANGGTVPSDLIH